MLLADSALVVDESCIDYEAKVALLFDSFLGKAVSMAIENVRPRRCEGAMAGSRVLGPGS